MSSSSSSSSSSASINDSVAALVQLSVAEDSPIEYVALEGDIYSCKDCKTHLALSDDIVSKHFHCKNGKAYLFSKVVNVTVGVKEDRMLLTGMHAVCDILCDKCGTIVGWTYVRSVTVPNESQKFKEGKSILERVKLCGPDGSNSVSDEAHIGGSDQDDI